MSVRVYPFLGAAPTPCLIRCRPVLRSRNAWLLALALGAGAADAAAFLGIGRVFVANMTGNTVLLGVAAIARGSGGDFLRSASALVGFSIGVSVGTLLITRGESQFPRLARNAFVLETAALGVLLVCWAAIGVSTARDGLIAVAGLAMGIQSAAVLAAHTGGVATTYVTGTLTTGIARLTNRLRGVSPAGDARLPGEIWASYAIGAIAGGLTVKWWGAGSIVITLTIVAVACVRVVGAHDRRRELTAVAPDEWERPLSAPGIGVPPTRGLRPDRFVGPAALVSPGAAGWGA